MYFLSVKVYEEAGLQVACLMTESSVSSLFIFKNSASIATKLTLP
jgi:hypothetical protein